ncbi:hypothetical protein HY441_01725 [Candidatus Microgenomates bacterium]|nr:hypothetical protein [Candidatus Microgenomates bacterium]
MASLNAPKTAELAQEQPAVKHHHWGFFLIFVIILGLLAYSQFGSFFFVRTQPISTDPAPAREYLYQAPSAEALNRQIDCTKVPDFEDLPRTGSILCLNLYQTLPGDIQTKLSQGSYSRVILYGQRVIFDSPTQMAEVANLPKSLYDTTLFNDQITLPRLMDLYGFTDLNFPGNQKVNPYPSITYRLSNEVETDVVCSRDVDAAGCSESFYASMISSNILKPRQSEPQKAFIRPNSSDELSYDLKWPANCYTDNIFLHETAHNFLESQRMKYAWNQPFVVPLWFNEQLSGLIETMAPDLVCGSNTRSNFAGQQNNDAIEWDIIRFNTIYPPVRIGHQEPELNQACAMAVLAQWYRYLHSGEWQYQWRQFFIKLRSLAGQRTLQEDQDLGQFILDISGDDQGRQWLQTNGCRL